MSHDACLGVPVVQAEALPCQFQLHPRRGQDACCDILHAMASSSWVLTNGKCNAALRRWVAWAREQSAASRSNAVKETATSKGSAKEVAADKPSQGTL